MSRRTTLPTAVLLAVALATASLAVAAAPPAPAAFFGFEPGTDRRLVDYDQLIGYLEALDEASPRVEMREVGRTPLDRPMFVAFISAPENLVRLDELRELNRRLALEAEIPDAERDALAAEARVFVMATLSMHSSEVGPSQAFPLIAHELATTDDAELLAALDKVVLMVVPCHNPDGMQMVVDYYRKTKGTRYEGGTLPGVYHRYVGHDNNRDFVALTQADTRVINRLYSTEWYPQVLVEKHQMGRTGPRYFVPSNHDPIAENVDEGLWTWSAVFGSNLSNDLAADGLRGVASHWLFDDYWPGSTETSLWKNVISFLTEAASCKVATPVFVEPSELKVFGKGLAEYAKSVNMPDPWPGGWWRLGDIVALERSSTRSILLTAARHRSEILRFRNEMCRSEIAKGRTEPPYYYVLPPDQHDRGALAELVELLGRHGVVARRLGETVEVEGRVLAAGSLVVPLAQPYRAFVKEVMEDQRYPVRHYTPGGEVIRPYDITTWSLPRAWGLDCVELDVRSNTLEAALTAWPERGPATVPDSRFATLAYPASDNASYHAAFLALAAGIEVRRTSAATELGATTLPAGSFLLAAGRGGRLERVVAEVALEPMVVERPLEVAATRLAMPRVALVETAFHDMDAGWTRYLFDRFEIPYRVVGPGDFDRLELTKEVDVVVFPDQSPDVLRKGKYKRGDRYVVNDLPPDYTKPLSDDGLQSLWAFIEGGGTVVAWGRSADVFLGEQTLGRGNDEENEKESFELPARDVSEQLAKQGLFVPGASLRVELLEGHPLTWGMPATADVFARGRPVFETSIPILDTDRRVVARFPEREILVSGYVEGEQLLARKAAMVWLRKGKGELVVTGFAPQFRGSTPATFKLVFNALLLPQAEVEAPR